MAVQEITLPVLDTAGAVGSHPTFLSPAWAAVSTFICAQLFFVLLQWHEWI
jgi:hypothetical protein